MVFLSETRKLCLPCLEKKSLIVAVPNYFTSVIGRYLFQVKTPFDFYFAFYFFICKILSEELTLSLANMFLITAIAKSFFQGT